MLEELGEVLSEQRLAAGDGPAARAEGPRLVHDLAPLVGGELGGALGRRVGGDQPAVTTGVGTAIGEVDRGFHREARQPVTRGHAAPAGSTGSDRRAQRRARRLVGMARVVMHEEGRVARAAFAPREDGLLRFPAGEHDQPWSLPGSGLHLHPPCRLRIGRLPTVVASRAPHGGYHREARRQTPPRADARGGGASTAPFSIVSEAAAPPAAGARPARGHRRSGG